MIWASIGKDGVGKIVFLKNNQRMNSQIYVKILQRVIPGEMKKHNAKKFIQDRATCHTSKTTI